MTIDNPFEGAPKAPFEAPIGGAAAGAAFGFTWNGTDVVEFNVTADEDPPLNTGYISGRIRAKGLVAAPKFWRGWWDAPPAVIPAAGFRLRWQAIYGDGNFNSDWTLGILGETKTHATEFLSGGTTDRINLRAENTLIKLQTVNAGARLDRAQGSGVQLVDTTYHLDFVDDGSGGWNVTLTKDPDGSPTVLINAFNLTAAMLPGNLANNFGIQLSGQQFDFSPREANLAALQLLPLP